MNVRTVSVLLSDVVPATVFPPGSVSENVAEPDSIASLKCRDRRC